MDSRPPEDEYLAGYMIIPVASKVDKSYGAGFSMYVPAWPLLNRYPGHRFQSGLPGTWMFAQPDGPKLDKMYSDVEGGLGWWRDTRFPTETPKFIMGGVAPNFSEIANGPAHGWGTWEKPRGLYGVAQLSPWLLFPIDGLNLRQGVSGELFGYGYMPLPLTEAKATTAGKPIRTGNHSWTHFLNSENFKGPVAFFTPYFWSSGSVRDPRLDGQLLDSRPTDPNTALQMETQYIPCRKAIDSKGDSYIRVAPTAFPRNAAGESVLMHQATAYNRSALWDEVSAWFSGGPPSSGKINPNGSFVRDFKDNGYMTWEIHLDSNNKIKVPIDWKAFATPSALGSKTFGAKWNYDLAGNKKQLVTFPEYFKLVEGDTPKKSKWIPVKPDQVPVETGLQKIKWERPVEKSEPPYTTPDEPKGSWKSPGPVVGPFKARLGDGSVVTYSWYRFADQPALLNADLTPAERERMQKRVEMLHRTWTKDRDYLPRPTLGKLAALDPAQIVRPPKGFEIGYVPIATRQELEKVRS